MTPRPTRSAVRSRTSSRWSRRSASRYTCCPVGGTWRIGGLPRGETGPGRVASRPAGRAGSRAVPWTSTSRSGAGSGSAGWACAKRRSGTTGWRVRLLALPAVSRCPQLNGAVPRWPPPGAGNVGSRGEQDQSDARDTAQRLVGHLGWSPAALDRLRGSPGQVYVVERPNGEGDGGPDGDHAAPSRSPRPAGRRCIRPRPVHRWSPGATLPLREAHSLEARGDLCDPRVGPPERA